MINTTVTFYNVGLNEKNLPYNYTALSNILAVGQITNGGQAYELALTALPFGAVFNISQEVYNIVKSATYIKIINQEADNANAPLEVRYAFINNFLQIANGNYSVSYTIDDWTSFYLAPNSPYHIHIDGFTERANVPLLKDGRFATYDLPLTGTLEQKTYKSFQFINGTPLSQPTHTLPSGYRCAVYFISQPHYNGNPLDKTAHGTVNDFNARTRTTREIRRDNSNIYFMIFGANGYNAPIYNSDQSQILQYGGVFAYWQVNDASIEKIMYFNFIPTIDGYDFIRIINGVFVVQTNTPWDWEDNLADIIHVDSNILNPDIYGTQSFGYYKAIKINRFTPALEFKIKDLTDADLFTCLFSEFTKKTRYDDFLANSLYQYINEYRHIKIKYLDIEIDIPVEFLNVYTKFVVGMSGDGETIFLKINDIIGAGGSGNSNRLSATGQNTDYFDLTHVRDFKTYKNAKITGAAGIAATTIGSITALGSSIATGNVAGVVGALSGGAQGVLAGMQKLQGLTPQQQSPANGDITLTRILENYELTKQLCVEVTTVSPDNSNAKKRYLEENGALVTLPFFEYRQNCQMEAFNAIKMATIDVTGAPQQIARRIEETFLNGVTLWTSTDVGNKKVINYPLNS